LQALANRQKMKSELKPKVAMLETRMFIYTVM